MKYRISLSYSLFPETLGHGKLVKIGEQYQMGPIQVFVQIHKIGRFCLQKGRLR
jgi:hypothetical protein